MRKKAVRKHHPVRFTKHLFGDPTQPITGTSLLITNAAADATDGQEQFLMPRRGRVQGNPIQAQFMRTDEIWTLIEFQWDHLSERACLLHPEYFRKRFIDAAWALALSTPGEQCASFRFRIRPQHEKVRLSAAAGTCVAL